MKNSMGAVNLLSMKLYTTMPQSLVRFFETELQSAKNYLESDDFPMCWLHYERAHVIGQRYPYEHSLVHWKMLKFGIRIKSAKEIVGQIPRLVFGGVKSFVGTIPVGNTGGANVPPFKPMAIPKELLQIINQNS